MRKDGPYISGGFTQRVAKQWWRIAFAALTLAIVTAGIIVALPHNRAAHAARPHQNAGGASITIPSHWNYSNSVDAPPLKVTGAGFAPGEAVKIYWNYKSTSNPGTQEASATVSSTGTFTASFVTPLAPTATYTIAAVGTSDSATAQLAYYPQLYSFPRGAGPGSPITVHGNSYGANEVVNVYWNFNKTTGTGTLIATPTADGNGVFVTSKTSIPANTKPGNYYIGAVGQTSKAQLRFQVMVYNSMLGLAPVSGSAGTAVTVSALGLTGLETADIYWNNGASPVATGIANAFGHLPPTVFTVPSGTGAGAYQVKVVGRTSNLTITGTFNVVSPGSSLNITTGPVGVNVGVNGQGFTPHETVNILWNYTGPGTGTSVGSIAAGISGTFASSFNAPAATNGSYTVAFEGATSKSVTQNKFTLGSTLAANPNTNAPGAQITVVGSGFSANESVNLYWDGNSGTPLATAGADGNGNISQAITIPANAKPSIDMSGSGHSVTGVGQSSKKSFTASITVDTEWSSFGINSANTRENTHENLVSTKNVGSLVKKWAVPMSNPALGEESSPVYANGVVYVPSADGTLKAYNATSGALLWASKTASGFLSYASALVDPAAGLVFFGTCIDLPGPFYAIDAKTGAVKWTVILAGSQYNFPTLAFHNIYIGISKDGGIPTPTNDTAILALDEVTGRIAWQNSTNGGVWGAVGVDTTTKTVFTGIGDPDNAVEALNGLTGKVLWHTQIGANGNYDVGTAITVANGLVYTSAKDGNEYAFNESTGAIAWKTKLGTPTGNISSQAVSANGTLYVGSLNRVFFTMNAKTGAPGWKYGSPLFIFSSPAVANGVVYFADTDSNIYALDAVNGGNPLFSFKTGGKSFSSPIMVNGWLYFTSTDGMLYALSL